MKLLSWNVYWEGLVAQDKKCKIPDLSFEEQTEKLVSFDKKLVNPSILKKSINQNIEHLNQINTHEVTPEYMQNIKRETENIQEKINIYNKKDSKCRENILDKINEIHTAHQLDFICLQEASNLFVNDGVATFQRPFLQNFTSIYYKLENSTLITLINNNYEILEKHKWGFTNSRPFLIVKVKHRTTNKIVYIINVHLPHTDDNLGDTKTLSLIENLKYVISILKSKFRLAFATDGIIMAGDFNDVINKKISLYGLEFDYEENSPAGAGEEHRIVKERGVNIQKIKIIGTCCYDVGGNLDANQYDYKNWDHILINDKLQFTGINYPVKPNMNRLLSDHLPIVGHIEFRVGVAGAGIRGGYYEKYLKYKKKYLALKRLDIDK